MRLANDRTEHVYEGRVEIYHNGQWGTVCDDNWGLTNAVVVCKSLGYVSGSARTDAAFGEGSGPIWLDDVECSGDDQTLSDCAHPGWGVENCRHSEDASVICSGKWEVNCTNTVLWRHQLETFPRYWPLVRGIHRLPVDSPHKGKWTGSSVFCLICAWTNGWANNHDAGDLRRHRAHYDVTVMESCKWQFFSSMTTL